MIAACNSANPDTAMSGNANATLKQTTRAAAMQKHGKKMKTMINELQNKFKEFEHIKEIEKSMVIKQEAEQELIMLNLNEPVDTDYVMRQANMQWQLTEYDSELAKKEQLFRKVRENTYDSINDVKLAEQLQDLQRNSEISKKQAEVTHERLKLLEAEFLEVKKKYEELKLKEENEKLKSEIVQIKAERENAYDSINDVKQALCELKGQIDAIEREKEELQDLLRNSEISKKEAEATHERLRLKAESLEVNNQRMLKLKEENEKHCEKLKSEIVQIKAERVKLIRQMRADAEVFKKFKQEKEMEVSKLNAQNVKSQVAISKLQERNNKQKAMIRHKKDELLQIKRLKILKTTNEKKKQVAEKRQQKHEREVSSSMRDKLMVKFFFLSYCT